MSRRFLSLIQTIRSGISAQQFTNQVVSAKCLYYGISPFHTCSNLLQKENTKKQGEEHAKDEQRENHDDSSDNKDQQRQEQDQDKDTQFGNESESKGSKTGFNFSLVPVDDFSRVENKTKIAFHDAIDIYKRRTPPTGTEHIAFIYAALKHMKEFGVHKDLQTYKALIDVLPKGKYVPRSMFQSEYYFHPREQQCIVDLLEQMEDNAVIPDWEMETMLVNIFGRRGYPVRRYWRMMYWMPKFKNLSPWPLPSPVPEDTLELAKLAIKRIMTVDHQSEITVFQTKDVENSIDDTWIVSGQSPVQRKLLENHPVNKPIYVEGGFRIYLREMPMLYFILRAEPDRNRKIPVRDDYKADNVSQLNFPYIATAGASADDDIVNKPTVHEQEDGTFFAVCATGTSSKDSLLSWIRCLEKHGNPKLGKVSVLFTFKSPIGATVSIEDENEGQKSVDQEKPPIES
ncbi:unnamed protein product [Bemisia tabaci]|uniref:Evolutionarily conserved signaling intermediate in Toll pathway, mitochondrial n=1 Tax=Bemisia tabaci TaxID=7038 RepID=A0A9P0A6W4_BEMTA|nr:unnamed protein product [Bemisia tabaci]